MIYQSILISLLWSSLIVYRPVWCNSHPSYHLVSLFIPTPTLKHYCIWAIVTGLTLLMSRNKSCFGDVSCFSAALSDPTLLSGSCSQDLHYIYPGITVLTDPPPPSPCIIYHHCIHGNWKNSSVVPLASLLFPPQTTFSSHQNTTTLSESRCTTYIQVRLS